MVRLSTQVKVVYHDMGILLHSLVVGIAIFSKINFFPSGLQNVLFK